MSILLLFYFETPFYMMILCIVRPKCLCPSLCVRRRWFEFIDWLIDWWMDWDVDVRCCVYSHRARAVNRRMDATQPPECVYPSGVVVYRSVLHLARWTAPELRLPTLTSLSSAGSVLELFATRPTDEATWLRAPSTSPSRQRSVYTTAVFFAISVLFCPVAL